MGFWMDWELWEQMCFALVLIYGTCVHIYNNWRIRKIGAAEKLKKEGEEATVGTKDLDLIPFGSRALESGIEIEGIWVSKNNTPLASPIPAATPEGTRPGTPSCSNLDLGAAAVSSFKAESPAPGSALSVDIREEETLNKTNEQREGAATVEELNNKSSSGSSGTEISDELSRRPSPPDEAERESREQPYLQANPRSVSHSRNQSSSHIPVEGEDHLRALYSHRQSHVAETGQLGGPWRQQTVSS
ncbi:hypothetical protein MGYG_03409 [Nannizzia gypsea CBS 118893]|uniref:Uncharacterized protein n=1 Tax=Arthroderma gypseum (strain ATCC MYA-4604 / CBS 118893) TaxID=535722 RepID=E4UNF5_ARTGP|nr:hypothetical protein MGYG_03409 [Nannizzia gypsea CBS 118893]EFR00405.1 hypothetical protein MGYG_03409 [Nannizzia gypsea CBS 118893]